MPSIRFINTPSTAENDQIIALYRAEGWWYPDADQHKDAFRLSSIISGSHCFAVADMDGRVIAMGRAISDRFSDAYIQDVTVHADYRGRGVGTAIVVALADRLETDGIGWIGLIAADRSAAFYRQIGFSPMPDASPLLRNTT